MSVDIHYRLHGILPIRRFLNRHAPRFIAGVHAPTDQRAAHGDQITGNPLLRHQCSKMIRRIAFPDRRQIDKQIGNIFLQVLLPVLVDDGQML